MKNAGATRNATAVIHRGRWLRGTGLAAVAFDPWPSATSCSDPKKITNERLAKVNVDPAERGDAAKSLAELLVQRKHMARLTQTLVTSAAHR
jgi:hypothetical protein